MSTATAISLSFPAQSLLSLACQSVRLLHAHHTKQHQAALTTGDEDSEAESVENLTDVELTLQELDPVYWKELADERLQSTGEPFACTASSHAIFKSLSDLNFDLGAL